MYRNLRVRVMGATGLVGGALINDLKNAASIDVIAAARDVRHPSAFLDAIRHAGSLLKQSLIQPLAAALMVSLVLGTIPMILTALYSVVRIALGWCRRAGRLRRDDPVILAHSDELTNPMEIL